MKDCDKKAHLEQNAKPKEKFGAKLKQAKVTTPTSIVSRTTGRTHKINIGPQPGGLAASDPFSSLMK